MEDINKMPTPYTATLLVCASVNLNQLPRPCVRVTKIAPRPRTGGSAPGPGASSDWAIGNESIGLYGAAIGETGTAGRLGQRAAVKKKKLKCEKW